MPLGAAAGRAGRCACHKRGSGSLANGRRGAQDTLHRALGAPRPSCAAAGPCQGSFPSVALSCAAVRAAHANRSRSQHVGPSEIGPSGVRGCQPGLPVQMWRRREPRSHAALSPVAVAPLCCEEGRGSAFANARSMPVGCSTRGPHLVRLGQGCWRARERVLRSNRHMHCSASRAASVERGSVSK
jgi:hypothetical protein